MTILFRSLIVLLYWLPCSWSIISSTAVDHHRSLKKEDVAKPLVDSATTQQTDTSSSSSGPADIVQLVPFDVQIAVTINNGIQFTDVSNVVTQWLNQAYQTQLASFGYTTTSSSPNQYATFTSVILFDNNNNEQRRTRNLRQRGRQQAAGELFTAKFKGGAVFSKDSAEVQSVPENDVLLIQQTALLNDTSLLTMLLTSTAIGLGSAVIDVQAFLNPVGSSSNNNNGNNASSASSDSQFEIVIIVAIVVACVAFLFLVAAVFWAYLYDRSNRRRRQNDSDNESPRKKKKNKSSRHQRQPKTPATTSTAKKSSAGGRDRTNSSESGDEHTPEEDKINNNNKQSHNNKHDNLNTISPYPTMIDNSGAAEVQSVISDSLVSNSNMSGEISTSLSAYYRSGMGKVSSSEIYSARLQQQAQRGMLDDAGSVSSMESYGYSLGGDEITTATPHVVVIEQHHYDIDTKRERIGGLPVEPDLGNVQIPDLDKELAELDVQLLSPNMQEILMNTNINDDDDDLDPDVDLANYQTEDDDDDDEEIETVMDNDPNPFGFRQSQHHVVDVDDVKADEEVNEYPQESI